MSLEVTDTQSGIHMMLRTGQGQSVKPQEMIQQLFPGGNPGIVTRKEQYTIVNEDKFFTPLEAIQQESLQNK
jgi:hypothetical protein